MESNKVSHPDIKTAAPPASTREIFKQLYKEPKVFKAKDYAPLKHQFTLARKELAAYAFLCRQQEAREWLELVLGQKFPENAEPKSNDDAIMKRTYKSDLFPPLRDGMKLCKIVNMVKPNTVPKIAESTNKPFLMLENINFFLHSCKTLGVPEHKLFNPLDLLERKNMQRVVYCIHQFATIAYTQYGIGKRIEERTGAFQFDDDELEKAQRDLEEIENAEKGLKKSPSVKTPDDDSIRRHNEEQVSRNRAAYVLNQLLPAEVIVEGFSKAENVSGQPDGNYALCVDVIFADGSVKKKEHVTFNTGTHDWEQRVITINPEGKCIKEVLVYPEFSEHTGKVWFDKFGCFENRPPSNLIQFVQNPSFETADDGSDKFALFWEREGKGYVRDDGTHCLSGDYSITMEAASKSDKGSAVNHVTIFQNEPAPLFIEGWSRAENVSDPSDGNYAIVADVVYGDDSRETINIPFTTGTHDWEKKAFVLDPRDKPVKAMNVHCKFEGHTGKAWFDHVTVCQEEFKQYVKNPSFEAVDPSNGDLAASWTPEGRGYHRNHKDWCVYGHTSAETVNEKESDESVIRQLVVLNQKKPNDIVIEGWSKAENVSGDEDEGYAIVADIAYQDNSRKKVFVPFSTGSHDWERKILEHKPNKPIKEILLTAQLKGHSGRALFDNITVSEEYTFGESEVYMIQKILKSLGEDKDWLDEITELKRRLLIELRKNHQVERELAAIEKRIALLIKNRIDIQEVLQASKRAFRLFKKKPKKDASHSTSGVTIEFIKKKLGTFQEFFYLLQTEPKYLAKVVTLISPSEMESFLETVILTLFGDAYSPREEYLLLRVLHDATYNEMISYKDVAGFLEANTVTAKMIVTYNRRAQGHEFLVKTLAPLLQKFIQMKDLDLEISPMKAYNALIVEEEMATGEKSKKSRATNDEEALQKPEVRELVKKRVEQLRDICALFLDVIVSSMEQLPYGLRWICKQIVEIGTKNFKGTTLEQVQKTIGYFVYYRFFNPAIVSPDLYDIIRLNLSNTQRKNLVQVAKVLQSLFNFATFTEGTGGGHIDIINDFIKANKDRLSKYLTALVNVPEPSDYLMVDQYLELTQGTKPVVLMTYDEIYSTHEVVLNNIDAIAKDKKDPLRVIVDKLGPLPDYDLVDDDLERELQLTLTNPFTEEVAKKELQEEKAPLSIQTRDLFMDLLRSVEPDTSSTTLWELYNNVKKATVKKTEGINQLLKKIGDNLDQMEKDSKQEKSKICAQLMEDISAYVANEASIKIQRKNIIARLRLGLENLHKNQKYMNEQMESFNTYLEVARNQQSANSKKKKKVKGVKLSYSKLHKQGIIVSSSVPEKSKKATSFTISPGENMNEFTVKAKIAGVTADTITLLLDDLLEKQSQNIEQLELDNVTLDVNLTVHFINKTFLQKA